jgi:DNA-binding winged helix-turn-helix (wHTH) protein/tetratricopeptide (TPR) repeat protein
MLRKATHEKSQSLRAAMKEFSPFRLDIVNQCLWRHSDDTGEQRILLTPKAFAMLRYLVEHAGRLVTPDELLEALWPDTFVQPEVIKSHVRDIRGALGDDAKNARFIETLPRRGYRFIAPVTDGLGKTAPEVESPLRLLVGRNTELNRLRGSLQRALRGDRQFVFVTGEPGIGKTTLVDEFQRIAADNSGFHIARGQCVEGYSGQEPYYPMLEAVGQLCRGSAADSMVQILAAQAPTWLVQFPALVKREQRDRLQREIVGATRERMLREIADALEAMASQSPLLLVLEDLHWADRSTVDLISALARRRQTAKLMLIGTYRPVDVLLADHPLKGLKQDLLIHHLCHEIALEALGEAEVAEYLARQSAGFEVPEGLAGLIYRHSEGNPLFMVTALDHMCDRGLIALENGSWHLRVPLEKIDLKAPETLRQMIELRIERLSTEEQRVLEIMSLPKRFSLSVAVGSAVANVEPETFEEWMEGLARRHQIVRSAGFRDYRTGPSPCYEFAHALYKHVVYGRIAPARRRKLHRSLAEHAARLQLLSTSETATEQAYQFEEAGEWFAAVKHLQIAADNAVRRFEPKQAAAILEHARELLDRIPEAERAQSEIQILQKLATIYVASFDTRAVETYETLAVRAARYGLPDVEVRALLEMAVPLARVSNDLYMRALDRARDALSRCGEGDTLERAVRRVLLSAYTGEGKLDPDDMEEGKNLVAKLREAGNRPLLGEIQFGISYPLFNSSEYREALRSAEEGFAILLEGYEENPYLTWNFQMYVHLVVSCDWFLGEWGEALRKIERRVEMAEKNDDRLSPTLARLDRSWIQSYAMDFTGAQQSIESALPLVPTIPSLRHHCLIMAGFAEGGLGNHERALEYLLECRHEMEQHPLMTDWYDRMLLQQALTEAWLSKGDLAQARLEAEEFLKVTLTNGERTFRGLAFEAKARVAMAEGDLPRAQDCITQAVQAMEGFEVPLAHWKVHATAYELYQRMKQQGAAKKHRELSRATIVKLANSLPEEEPLRQIFLSAPLIRKVIGDDVLSAKAE